MEIHSREIESVFDKLLGITGSEGASLFTPEGRMIVFKHKDESSLSPLPESFSEFISAALNTVLKADFGDLEQIIVLDHKKKILIHKVQEKNCYSILFGTPEMNTGLACIKTKEMIPFFEKLI